ncbi:MAG: glycosyltransferase [Clostridiales bacterium]|nr:glycosyltransferase [Clostridiales bacterium]
MKPQECCVLIPSLSPDDRLPAYVNELHEAGFALVLVVDDGSAPEYQPIFSRIDAWEGCHVLHHDVNHGKGQALRTGYAYIRDHTDLAGILTADSDGQHTVPDTLRLAKELGQRDELLLGSRDFSRKNKNVPPKSRFGNRMTSFVFKLLYGHWLPDTQTGLRAFDRKLLDFMLSVKGDRFEYEMNVLIQCAGAKVPMRAITIETIYMEENKGTHFHPIRDSWRIYKLLLGNFFRFMSVSILCWAVDILLFSLLKRIGALAQIEQGSQLLRALSRSAEPVLLATALARVVSAAMNFLLNKSLVFNIKKARGAVWKYIVLCIGVMLVSGVTVSALHALTGINSTVIKMVVDLILFLINYRIQKAWVFPQEKAL